MSSSSSLEAVDITSLNALAAGTNKKNPRIVAAGVGGLLMGTKSLVDVTADQITETSTNDLLEKDKKEAEKYRHKKHISEKPWTLSNWPEHINWLNMVLVVFIPMFGFYSAVYYPPQLKTAVLGIILYVFSGISITAGYHRLYAHKSYDAALPVRLFSHYLVQVPLKVPLNGGVTLTEFTIVTLIRLEILTMPDKGSGTPTWAGCLPRLTQRIRLVLIFWT